MTDQVRWLLLEGVAALFGAGFLYLALGACYRIVGNSTPFAWSEAFDSMGWLYGSIVIGIQAAVRLFRANGGTMDFAAYSCVALTVFSCLLLIVAMLQRGVKASWKPPVLMRLFAASIAGTILFLGYISQHVAVP